MHHVNKWSLSASRSPRSTTQRTGREVETHLRPGPRNLHDQEKAVLMFRPPFSEVSRRRVFLSVPSSLHRAPPWPRLSAPSGSSSDWTLQLSLRAERRGRASAQRRELWALKGNLSAVSCCPIHRQHEIATGFLIACFTLKRYNVPEMSHFRIEPGEGKCIGTRRGVWW